MKKKQDFLVLLFIIVGVIIIYNAFNTPVQSVSLPEGIENAMIVWQSFPKAIQYTIIGLIIFFVFTLVIGWFYK